MIATTVGFSLFGLKIMVLLLLCGLLKLVLVVLKLELELDFFVVHALV